MIIKQVKLHNIRSYLDQEIKFPLGSTLLSGDIGSGKSTILLAIEFALFGLQRGIIDGSSLLRNDKDEGHIELDLIVAKKPIIIKRSLKRNKSSRTVMQSAASIVVDDQKRELTATELKLFVLNILNYPASLLTKRNLIYRYTVYCPQEEMKRIVLETTEERLDTLRKVFDIDRYKRILENSQVFVSQLKERKKVKEGQLADLPFKQAQLKEKNQNLDILKKKLEEFVPILVKKQQEVNELKNKIRKEREIVEKITKVKAKISSCETMISEKKTQLKNLENEGNELTVEIENLGAELKDFSPEREQELKKQIFQLENEIKTGRDNERVFEQEIAALDAKKESLNTDSGKISALKICPVCKQEVTPKHRLGILGEIEAELKKIKEETKRKQLILDELKQDIKKLELKLKELAEKEKILSVLNFKSSTLKEKEDRKLKVADSVKEIKENLVKLEEEKKIGADVIEQNKGIGESYKKTELELEQKQKQEKTLLVEKAGLDQSLKDTERELAELKQELEKKKNVEVSLRQLEELQSFLTKNFAMLIELMEKQVMLKLNREFNALFRGWFAALVDDPGLEASVDVEFSPLIEQAGYEINYRYLSGGERTALALAYRLALNQVINSMLSKINTKNLLILDEPTDGFSSEQLDKIRDVLQELRAEQIILVSHETKVESFVENVIRFVKQGHVSKIDSKNI